MAEAPVFIPYHPDHHVKYPPVTRALAEQGLEPVWVNAYKSEVIVPSEDDLFGTHFQMEVTPPAVTLNRGIRQYIEERGETPEYIYSCDAHMVAEPDAHERMMLRLAEYPGAVCIHGYAYHWQVIKGPWRHSLLEWQYDPVPCLSLWHLPTLLEHGGFNPNFRYGHIITTCLRLVHHGHGAQITSIQSDPPQKGSPAVPGTHRLAGHHVDPDMDLRKFLWLHYIAGECMADIDRIFPSNPYIQGFKSTFTMAKQLNPNQVGALIKSNCHGLNLLGAIAGFRIIPQGKITSAGKEVKYIFEDGKERRVR
jgi:hypothetical protein